MKSDKILNPFNDELIEVEYIFYKILKGINMDLIFVLSDYVYKNKRIKGKNTLKIIRLMYSLIDKKATDFILKNYVCDRKNDNLIKISTVEDTETISRLREKIEILNFHKKEFEELMGIKKWQHN